MQQLIKRYCWVALLVASAPVSWGFALLGPLVPTQGDTWETGITGYRKTGDIGTPKNIGEGYRRNTPILYYAYDANFSSYFGSNGEAAVDSAVAIMNSVSNVDNYSPALYEVTMDSAQSDNTANALGLTDLKSHALQLLTEQMGLAQPERYTWTLHDSILPSGGVCPPDNLYLVVQRNFDPITSPLTAAQYSSYVNGTLYTYQIQIICPDSGVTQPYSTDPLVDDAYSSVASLGAALKNTGVGLFPASSLGTINFSPSDNWAAVQVGGFYNGLTRDDVAGMRYLYSTNNVAYESPALGAVQDLITTNTSAQQTFPNILLGTNLFYTATAPAGGVALGTNGYNYYYYYDGTYGYGDYSALVSLSKITSPANLQLLYPGLVIASTSNYLAYVTNVTATYSFQYPVGKPIGTPPVLVAAYQTNVTFGLYYNTTFGNVYTNFFTNHFNTAVSAAYMVTNILQYQPGKPLGSALVTNITASLITNYPGSEFFLMTAFYNTNCPLAFLSSPGPLKSVYYTTNPVAVALAFTNTTVTNSVTNNAIFTGVVDVVTAFTNYTYAVNPVTCAQVTNNTANWFQGIGRIQFVREPDTSLVDPLTDVFVTPITNNYTMVNYIATNNAFQTLYYQRIVTAPDVLFDAVDLSSPNSAASIGILFSARNVNFNTANELPGLAGPGTINTPTVITFNRSGNAYANGSLAIEGLAGSGFLSEFTQFGLLAWGSFDGSTNIPVVYPSGTSIQNIENQLIVNISPTAMTTNGLSSLSAGTNSVAYPSVQFSASGGVAPYTWGLGQGTALPAGLTLSAGGLLSGTPTGAPVGTYDFTVEVTDSANRVVDFPGYAITIH